jgi:hypothetical protein
MIKKKIRKCNAIVLLFWCCLISTFLNTNRGHAEEFIKACNIDYINISGLSLEQEKYKELALNADERDLEWITINEALGIASRNLEDLHNELELLQKDYYQLTIKLNSAIDELDYENIRLTFAQHKMWLLVKDVYHAQNMGATYKNKAIEEKNAYDFEYEEAKKRVSMARSNLNMAQKAIDKKYKKAKTKSNEINKAQNFHDMIAYLEAKALLQKTIAENELLAEQIGLIKNISSKVNTKNIKCHQLTDSTNINNTVLSKSTDGNIMLLANQLDQMIH